MENLEKEVEERQKTSSGGFSLALAVAGIMACSEETIRLCGYMLLTSAALSTLINIYYDYRGRVKRTS